MTERVKIGSIVAALIILSVNSYSQGYMDEIALKACECLDKVSTSVNSEQYIMELGLCMIAAATPYKKQLKKDHKIDLNKINTQGEELGAIIGLRMATVCPESLIKMASQVNDNNMAQSTSLVYDGRVTNTEGNQFIVFSVKDNNGKITKFYWLTFIDTDIELTTEYKLLVDKLVRITFVHQEFFDSRIGEYRNFNIIQKLQELSE